MVEVGSQVSTFEAPIARGEHGGDEFSIDDTLRVEDFSLDDALADGPIVLAFFPGAFTPVCWDEMREFQDSLEEFDELGVAIYGVSVDSPFTQNKFIDEAGLSFPLLSDHDKELIEAFDVVQEDFSDLEPFGYNFSGDVKVAKRSIFAIDPDGRVEYTWVDESPMGLPDVEEVKHALQEVV